MGLDPTGHLAGIVRPQHREGMAMRSKSASSRRDGGQRHRGRFLEGPSCAVFGHDPFVHCVIFAVKAGAGNAARVIDFVTGPKA